MLVNNPLFDGIDPRKKSKNKKNIPLSKDVILGLLFSTYNTVISLHNYEFFMDEFNEFVQNICEDIDSEIPNFLEKQATLKCTEETLKTSVKGAMQQHPFSHLVQCKPLPMKGTKTQSSLDSLLVLRAVTIFASIHLSKHDSAEDFRGVFERALSGIRLLLTEPNKLKYKLPDFCEILEKPDTKESTIFIRFHNCLINICDKIDNRPHQYSEKPDSSGWLDSIRILFDKITKQKEPITKEVSSKVKVAQAVSKIELSSILEEDENASLLIERVEACPSSLRIPTEEYSDDQERNSFYLENHVMNHKDTVSHIALMQAHANAGFSNALMKRKVYPTSSPHRLSDYEAQVIYQDCLSIIEEAKGVYSVKEFSYLFLALSLTLGAPIGELSATRITLNEAIGADDVFTILTMSKDKEINKWITHPGYSEANDPTKLNTKKHAFLAKTIRIPRRSLPTELKREPDNVNALYEHRVGGHLYIPLDDRLVDIFIKYQNASEMGVIILDTATSLTKTSKKLHRKITPLHIANYLTFKAYHASIDSTIRSLLTNETRHENAGLYYAQISCNMAFRAYLDIIKPLGLHLLEFKQPCSVVGSLLVPTVKVLKDLFRLLHDEIYNLSPETEEEWIEYHNLYTFYVYQVLNLTTGHRPRKNAYSERSLISIEGQCIFILDKDTNRPNSGRELPLTCHAIEQLQKYNDHLRNMRHQLSFENREGKCIETLDQVLDEENPSRPFLFFFGKRKTALPLSSEKLSFFRMTIWSLPSNWHRHVLRSFLMDSSKMTNDKNNKEFTLSPEIIDAFMGHSQYGQGSSSPLSGLCFSKLIAIKPSIENIFQTLEIKPL